MDLMEIVAEEPSLKGTLFEDLFQIMQSGQLMEEKTPVKPGEEVVGEMNKLERALSTLFDKYADAQRSIASRAREEARCRACACDDKERMACELAHETKALRQRSEAAAKLMWSSIEQRLAGCNKPEATGWGIRTGGQIVLMFEKKDDSLLGHISLLDELLGAIVITGGRVR